MKKKAKDIICKCGHSKKSHDAVGSPIWDEFCTGERIQDRKKGNYIYICLCPEYRPDNLSHIEKIAKDRNLI